MSSALHRGLRVARGAVKTGGLAPVKEVVILWGGLRPGSALFYPNSMEFVGELGEQRAEPLIAEIAACETFASAVAKVQCWPVKFDNQVQLLAWGRPTEVDDWMVRKAVASPLPIPWWRARFYDSQKSQLESEYLFLPPSKWNYSFTTPAPTAESEEGVDEWNARNHNVRVRSQRTLFEALVDERLLRRDSGRHGTPPSAAGSFQPSPQELAEFLDDFLAVPHEIVQAAASVEDVTVRFHHAMLSENPGVWHELVKVNEWVPVSSALLLLQQGKGPSWLSLSESWSSLLKHPAKDVRLQAIQAVSVIGKQRRARVAEMVEELTSDDAYIDTTEEIDSLLSQTVPELKKNESDRLVDVSRPSAAKMKRSGR